MDADQWKHYTHTYTHSLFEDWGGGVGKDPKTEDLQRGKSINHLSGFDLLTVKLLHFCQNIMFNQGVIAVYWSLDCQMCFNWVNELLPACYCSSVWSKNNFILNSSWDLDVSRKREMSKTLSSFPFDRWCGAKKNSWFDSFLSFNIMQLQWGAGTNWQNLKETRT